MSELRESLSAMMDGEASEIEVHRLLRQINEDPALKQSWLHWHQTRTLLQGQRVAGRYDLAAHLTLQQKISEAIAGEPPLEASASRGTASITSLPTRAWQKPAAAMAMAASLVVAVFVGMQIGQPATQSAASPALATTTTTTLPTREPIAVQTVANGATTPRAVMPGASAELRELDEEGQRRLRAYLQQHDRLTRMDARLVSYPQPGQKQ